MQRTRTNHIPSSYALAAMLAALLVLATLNFSSSGIVRGGEEDGGSGIGGTGRMLSPGGGSGIGGTGLKPYLGLNAEQEMQILFDPALRHEAIINTVPDQSIISIPVALEPLPAIASVSRETERTLDSSALDISELIQANLAADAVTYGRLRDQLLRIEVADALPAPLTSGTNENDLTAAQSSATHVSWEQVSKLLRVSPNQVTTTESTELADAGRHGLEAARLTRPERVLRPELPALQRVSPLGRSAILPPRVQPMRL